MPRRAGAPNALRYAFRLRGPDEVDEEFRFHLDLRASELVARGWSNEAARSEAQCQFGDIEDARSYCRETMEQARQSASRGDLLDQLRKDVVFTLRAYRRSPGFAVIAVLILALAIGANTAVFSVVRGVLLKPLGYPDAGRLVVVTSQLPLQGQDQFPMAAAEFVELRERSRSFDDIGAYSVGAATVGPETRRTRVVSARVSASLFAALGVAPQLGATFALRQTLPNAPPIAVLSDALWRGAYSADPSIVGSSIDIDGAETTVVGVMPPAFDVHDERVQVWLPLRLDPAQISEYRGVHVLTLVGRLKRDVSLAQARSELDSLLTAWPATTTRTSPNPQRGEPGFLHVPTSTDHRLRYDDLRTDIVRDTRTALWTVQSAVALILLIACANLANLLLMRTELRHQELAVRAALGAGRRRLLTQFGVESLVLCLMGGIGGFVLAQWGVDAAVAAHARDIPRAASIGLDGTVLAFSALLVLGTSVVLGLAPFLNLSPRAVAPALSEAGSRTTAGTARNRLRRGLVVAQIAMAAMLIAPAGLLTRSLWNLLRVDAGFDRTRLTTFGVALPPARYPDNAHRAAFFDRLTRAVGAVPGVDAAAAMYGLPPSRYVNENSMEIEGRVPTPGGPDENVDFVQTVTRGYFATMGIPVVAGRAFDGRDGASSPPVVVINEAFVRLFYPERDPLGLRIRPAGTKEWLTVVGVAKDVKQSGLDANAGTELYLAYEQTPRLFPHAAPNMNIVVRSRLAAAALAPPVQRAVRALDPTLPVTALRTMDDVFAHSVSRPRLLAQLLSVFGAVALALAAIGTYGVLTYSVAVRRQEIGIRLVLGANARGVLSMVLSQGMALAGIGLAIGLGAAAGATQLARSLLFGVGAADPLTLAFVAVLLLVVSFIACLLPARRATRVDPAVALRAD